MMTRRATQSCRLIDSHGVDQLNIVPTLAFATPVFVIYVAAVIFVEMHVMVTNTTHLTIFSVGFYVIFSTYYVADYHMKTMSRSYDAIPEDKRFYVLSNLIKSAVLCAYCPSCVNLLYRGLVLDEWVTTRIRTMGVLYAIPDAVSLLVVSRMATSTRVHHICVVIFMFVNLQITYEEKNVGRALMVYGIFSTFAYLVNLLLASRFLPIGSSLARSLSVLAFIVYFCCLLVNWTWQVHYLIDIWHGLGNARRIMIVAYVTIMTMVVRDDCVLIRWLYKNMRKHTRMAEKTK